MEAQALKRSYVGPTTASSHLILGGVDHGSRSQELQIITPSQEHDFVEFSEASPENVVTRTVPPNSVQGIEDQTSRLPFGRLISAYSCLAAIYFISSLDINSVATALPVISRSLNAGNSITWTGTAYLMGQTAFQVLYGRLSDIFGRKPILFTCVGFLILGDLLCGFAKTATWLYVCRALSGVGGGGISSLVQITVSDLVSLKDRGKYQGLLSGAIGLGSSAGPFIAASMLRNGKAGWRWIFWVPPILAAACVVLMWMSLPLKTVAGSWQDKLRKIDWFGLGVAVAGMLFLLVGSGVPKKTLQLLSGCSDQCNEFCVADSDQFRRQYMAMA